MLVRLSWRAYSEACARPSRLSQASSCLGGYAPRPLVVQEARRCFSASGWTQQNSEVASDEPTITKEVRERKQELERANVNAYPRLEPQSGQPGRVPKTIHALSYSTESSDQPEQGDSPPDTAAGRIVSIRHSGKKLVFFDLKTDQRTMQLMLNHAALRDPKPSESEFQDQCRLLRRGDHIAAQVKSTKTRDGKPALQALTMPVLQSPCLQRLPVSTAERHTSTNSDSTSDRHIDMLTSADPMKIIVTRSNLFGSIRNFLSANDFVEVVTPILAAQAGGATARHFQTSATEFPNRKLALRIAPELWLKKLVIGGMSKIFELGPSFRNEGLDKTHNPEFTTCEFYAAYWTLPKLQLTTENLLMLIVYGLLQHETEQGFIDRQLANDIMPRADLFVENNPEIDHLEFMRIAKENKLMYPAIDFITALNTLLGVELPNLASPNAREEVLEIFHTKDILLPEKPTLPRLLDKLSSQFLEPHCQAPTWIENLPECLSPLAKSFMHPTAPNSQAVAARAELFIRGKEVVNCYEEENDPFEQRRKFIAQQKYARDPDSGKVDEEAMTVDEGYIHALEWGLPPTGGWGMGIDRLLMLLTGRDKIADVLTFGNLRAVTRGAEKWKNPG